MPYLIDGHNLIPKLGLRLDFIDDEKELITLLQEFCRRRRTQVEVYFDGAPAGQTALYKLGRVTAYFINKASSADAAIESRLKRSGKAAKNWTVVSSDNRIQRAAGAVHARVIPSEDFSREMRKASSMNVENPDDDAILSTSEVDEWMELFEKQGK
jgi:predicted RNA-binding protein with PIN domain